ncbi:MAG: hypothetical protein CMI18_10285 [Opitutaceae bacterium]|nr:hypothetical protein [Opitutaceae bacterium]
MLKNYFKPSVRWVRKGQVLGIVIITISLFPPFVNALEEAESLVLLVQTLDQTDDTSAQIALIKGVLSGLEGHRDVQPPPAWKAVGDRLMKSRNQRLSRLAKQLAQIFGDEAANQESLVRLQNRSVELSERQAALRTLLAQRNSQLKTVLGSLLDDPDLQIEAIRAYGTLALEDSAKVLLGRYASLDDSARQAIVETLATQRDTAEALLFALNRKLVSRKAIPSYVARSLQSLLGEAFTAEYGDIGALSKDKSELFARYRSLLTSDEMDHADAYSGRTIYDQVCGACHLMYGEGGLIGPDLTGSNRADLEYILLNILDPSDDVPDNYKMVTLTLKNGRVLTGTVTEEDGARLTLNAVGQKEVISKNDILSRDVSDISMMPEGLLMTLKDREVINLIHYLRTEKQVEAAQ